MRVSAHIVVSDAVAASEWYARAFGAEEQMLQVVAGVVLALRAQAIPDAAVGQDDFHDY